MPIVVEVALGSRSNVKTWSFISTAGDLTRLSPNAKSEEDDVRKMKSRELAKPMPVTSQT